MRDAELLDELALHLDDAHFQHDLFFFARGDHRNDFGRVADETAGDIGGVRGLHARLRRAAQNDVVIDGFSRDARVRHQARDEARQCIDVALDLDFEIEDLAPVRIEEERVRLTDRKAEEINAARRAHDRVDDARLRDQHVRCGLRKLDDRRLVERQYDALRHLARAAKIDRRLAHAALGARRRGGREGQHYGGGDSCCASREGGGFVECGRHFHPLIAHGVRSGRNG